jgi:hypothetical protein
MIALTVSAMLGMGGPGMRIPRVRFTVRRLMVAVVIAGIVLGIERLWHRSAEYAGIAGQHARKAIGWDEHVSWLDGVAAKHARKAATGTGDSRSRDRENADKWAAVANGYRGMKGYHEAMRDKYAHAARYPWLPVAPDPPEPE